MDTIVERCAGIDIGKAALKVTVRVQGGQGRKTRREVRTFGTTTPQLLRLRDWLVDEQVSVVAWSRPGLSEVGREPSATEDEGCSEWAACLSRPGYPQPLSYRT